MLLFSGCSKEEVPPPDDPVGVESNSSDNVEEGEEDNDSNKKDESSENEETQTLSKNLLESTKLTAEHLNIETEKADFGLTEEELNVKEEVIPLITSYKFEEISSLITDYFEENPIDLGDGPDSPISFLSFYAEDVENLYSFENTDLEEIQNGFEKFLTPEILFISVVNASFDVSKSAFTNDNCLFPESRYGDIEIYEVREITDTDFIQEVKETSNVSMYWKSFMQNYKLSDGYLTVVYVVDNQLIWHLHDVKILKDNDFDFSTVSRWKNDKPSIIFERAEHEEIVKTKTTALNNDIETESFELELTELEKQVKEESLPYVLTGDWKSAYYIVEEHFKEHPMPVAESAFDDPPIVSKLDGYYSDLVYLMQYEYVDERLYAMNSKNRWAIETMLSSIIYPPFSEKHGAFTNLDSLVPTTEYEYVNLSDILKITDEEFIDSMRDNCNVNFDNAYMVNFIMQDDYNDYITLTAYIIEIVESYNTSIFRPYKLTTEEETYFMTVKKWYEMLKMEEYIYDFYNQ